MKNLFLLFALLISINVWPLSRSKLSPWLRQLVSEEATAQRRARQTDDRQVCAFVRINGNASEVLQRYHSQSLSHTGDIHIANIPISQLSLMTADHQIVRIEASPLGEALLDTAATCVNVVPAYQGRNLPQAFTGSGVVVGVMDIGFDLTCPNFYTADLSSYRIKCLWDMLTTDTLGSKFPVGRDYVGAGELLSIQHSFDGRDFTHGTYTLGIAAGSGYGSPYRGIAPESDICIVANAVSNNKSYIDSTNLYKYTNALNALGFQYIFDYAQRMNQPCVISLSEGGSEDLWGECQLYYEMLDHLVGPGRIIVASAGNQGHLKTWMEKPKGTPSKGTFLLSGKTSMVTLKSKDDFQFRLVSYGTDRNDTLTVSSRQVLETTDSTLSFTFTPVDSVVVGAYPSCYDTTALCYDVVLYNTHSIGHHTPLSLELLGIDADVELRRMNTTLADNDANPLLNGADSTHNINSPAAAPCVISVGSTTYRTSIINAQGKPCVFINGDYGMRSTTSSVGPSAQGLIKPDVMAPGDNIISSYSSFYIAAHPDASDITWNKAYYDFKERTYAWNCNSGTSSSSPMVAGIIALWLQVRPDLTPQDVMQVIAHTSRHCDDTLPYPNNRYGYGEIDAYRGLLYLLGLNHIDELSEHQSPVVATVQGDYLQLQFPQPLPRPMSAIVYQLSGVRMCQFLIPSGTATHRIHLPSLRHGRFHAIQLDGYRPYSGSMLF